MIKSILAVIGILSIISFLMKFFSKRAKHKVFEFEQMPHIIQCDHCDYKVANSTPEKQPVSPEYLEEWVDMPCPECTENLCTREDLDKYKRFIHLSEKINKYWSWTTFFIPESKVQRGTFHSREGIKIKE